MDIEEITGGVVLETSRVKRKRGRPKVVDLTEEELNGVMGSGRNRDYAEPLSDADKKKLEYYRKVATKKGIDLKELELYNVFGPELELRGFIKTLVQKNGNLVSAVKEFYPRYGFQPAEACYVKGMEVLRSNRGKELLKEALDAASVNVSGIISRINNIANGEDTLNRDKLRALELLGQFLKVFEGEDKGKTINYNLNVTEDVARRLLERRTRHKIIDGGKFYGVDESQGDRGDVIDGQEVID